MTSDQYPLFTRLVPKTSFKGGRIADTDLLDLTEAAEFASVHAGKKITPKDFLRAAGRGEILLRARVHQTKRVQRVGGGDYFEGNQDTNGSIQNLPLSACKQLAAVGKAHWRGIDGFKTIGGILMRYTIAELLPDEPDFETVTADCMVTGDAVHALADAYIDEPAPEQNTAPPAPTEETKEPEYSGLTDSERKERARAINRATQAQWDRINNGRAKEVQTAAQQDTEENNYWFTLPSLIADKEQEITDWELMRAVSISEAQIKKENLATLRAELESLKNQSKAPYPALLTAPAQTAAPAPVVVGALVEPEKAGPLPLTTSDIAYCFAGLRWNEQQWKKPLGDKPKWLLPCIAIPGVRGVSETRWNPVLIGAALERNGHAKQNSIRARFQTKPLLAPWFDAWKTYEAENITT